MREITGCLTSAVPPFGSLFDLKVYLNPYILRDSHVINFPSGLRKKSVYMRYTDFISIENPITINVTKRRLPEKELIEKKETSKK